MGVGAGLYMCDVVKKVHVRYLISWWVLVIISTGDIFGSRLDGRNDGGQDGSCNQRCRYDGRQDGC